MSLPQMAVAWSWFNFACEEVSFIGFVLPFQCTLNFNNKVCSEKIIRPIFDGAFVCLRSFINVIKNLVAQLMIMSLAVVASHSCAVGTIVSRTLNMAKGKRQKVKRCIPFFCFLLLNFYFLLPAAFNSFRTSVRRNYSFISNQQLGTKKAYLKFNIQCVFIPMKQNFEFLLL